MPSSSDGGQAINAQDVKPLTVRQNYLGADQDSIIDAA
ncbi:unnamed protein product [Mycetohabitans rhizoxinica HKI 454]|uniref:Uncharacterized protein n=1 Tax=Mycetohabitans rhizoxinica (strain DSM 19002 / CIP 109453 / HKI 454) TaxID=882378 RepID=E5AP06_MYCRK|nr:unnamed protein product [Mycetohabitans rhizoxinica HKI 454]